MNVCPFCRRRLLSQASPACNWCGKEIPDAAYQQRAAMEREVRHVQQALHDAQSLAAMEGTGWGMDALWISPLDLLRTRPAAVRVAPPPVMPAVNAAPPAEEPAPDDAAGGRFRHLEL